MRAVPGRVQREQGVHPGSRQTIHREALLAAPAGSTRAGADVEFLHQPRVLLRIRLRQLAERFRRATDGLERTLFEIVEQLRIGQRFLHRLIHLLDQRGRRFRRSESGVPGFENDALVTGLIQRRDVLQRRCAMILIEPDL